VSWGNKGTEDIFNGDNTRDARNVLPRSLMRTAARKLDLVVNAATLEDLRTPPSNHLEALRGDRRGQHSIRINGKYRICFTWTDGEAQGVEIVDYH